MGRGLNEVTYSKVYAHIHREWSSSNAVSSNVIRDTNRNSKVNALEQQRGIPFLDDDLVWFVPIPVFLIHLVVFRTATDAGSDNERR